MLPKRLIPLFCCLLFCLPLISYAQGVKVTCKLVDRDSVAIPFAAIQVSSATDSAHEHFEDMGDSIGQAHFTLQNGKKYIIRTHAMGYKPAVKNILVKGSKPTYIIYAEQEAKNLKDVVITYKRPLLRQEDDKTIVDPEELANSSTSAYDIMEKVPGLFVDQDGNIYITSTTPATVYINGREQKMGNEEVAAILKSLPPNSIEKIEILRTPSTRYDASSSGGIVNVVLKKGVRIGLSGSANAGMNQGVYGNQFAGIFINNSDGKLTSSVNLQISSRNNGERLKTDRSFAVDSLLSQNAYTTSPGETVHGNYSFSYAPNDKWEVTYDGRISLNQNSTESNSPAAIYKVSTGDSSVNYTTAVNNTNKNINLNQGISSKYKIDTSGSEWTTDFSWNFMPVSGQQGYNTVYTRPLVFNVSGNGDISSNYHYLSAQTDFTKKFPHKISAETGLKASNVWFQNTTDYNITLNDTITRKDPSRSNAYKYDEHIYAAYLQASKGFGKFLIKSGVRAENTNMFGNQTQPSDTSFRITRTDLFPYLYLSQKVMSIAGYELRAYLIYRRTITRPAYEYLNPFPRYVDQYLSESGNPSLRPQFTKNYEANISVDERPIFAFGYNDMTDMFSQVIYQANNNQRETYRTYDNLGSNKEIYFRGIGAIPPGKVYFFVVGGQYNHNVYSGYYNGLPLSYTRGSWTFFMYQTLKLGKFTQFVVSGFMRYKSQIQFYELSNFGALNLSLNRQFLNKKLKVTLSANDVLFTNNNVFTISQGNIQATGLRRGDTRRFGVNMAYNFGIRKKDEHNFLNAEPPENANK